MRLYLGVDGVINAFKSHHEWGLDGADSDSVCGYDFMWSQDMINALVELHEAYPQLELVWVSTWQDDCVAVAEAVGLGDWGTKARILRPHDGKVTHPGIFWKAEVVWNDIRIGFGKYEWAWFESDIWKLREPGTDSEYSDLLGESGGGYVPDIFRELGIGKEHILALELMLSR